jgi:hypothetical protein
MFGCTVAVVPPLRSVVPIGVKAEKLPLGVTAILFPPVPLFAPVARAVIVRLLLVPEFAVAVRTASVVVLLFKTLAIVEARVD